MKLKIDARGSKYGRNRDLAGLNSFTRRQEAEGKAMVAVWKVQTVRSHIKNAIEFIKLPSSDDEVCRRLLN